MLVNRQVQRVHAHVPVGELARDTRTLTPDAGWEMPRV